MASETARPPPGAPQPSDVPTTNDPKLVIQLYYPNNIAIAHAVAAHIKKRSEDTLEVPLDDSQPGTGPRPKAYAGLKPVITVYEKLPENIRGVIAHALVIGFDEACDPIEIFAEIRRYFIEQSAVIIHITTDGWIDTFAFLQYNPIGLFSGYEFSKLDSLLEKAALEHRPTRKYPRT